MVGIKGTIFSHAAHPNITLGLDRLMLQPPQPVLEWGAPIRPVDLLHIDLQVILLMPVP